MAALWEKYLPLIKRTVHSVTGLTEHDSDFEDMLQQSYFSFSDAVQSYDSSKGVKLSTHVVNRVKWGLYRYYERGGNTVRVPAYMRQRVKACIEKQLQLEAEAGKSVPISKAAEALGLSQAATKSVLDALQKLEAVSLDDDVPLREVLASGENVEEAALSREWQRELHELLGKALLALSADVRGDILLHYYQGVPVSRIAIKNGCTPQAVCNRENTAFRAIRTGKYGADLLEFMPDFMAKKRACQLMQRDMEALQLTEKEKGMLVL